MSKNKQPAKSFRRKTCVIATEIAISLMAAPLAFAQQAAEKVEKLEITGSRIPSPNVESTSPIAVISADDIKLEGSRNVESMLNNMPQIFADQNGTVANGASGTATVNLRGLGNNRTLVLMNGRRLPAGDITYSGGIAPDLNMIPTALIKRVEILTGGAGAVYGSDAVAGVVNFIMDDHFQGVQIDVNQTGYNHHQQGTAGVADVVRQRGQTNPSNFQVPGNKNFDGRTFDLALTMGSNFDGNKGNAVVFFSYKKTNALTQSERDFSACAVGQGANGFVCGGSSTSPTGRFLTDVGDFTVADAAGNVRPFSSALDQYNYGPSNHYQRPDERYNVAAFANYQVHKNAKMYMEFNFGDDHSTAQIAPGGIFGAVESASFDNPLLTDAWRAALGLANPGDTAEFVLLRRNVEGGGRQSEYRHTSFRDVIGVKGDIGKWNYDVFAENARMIYSQAQKNYFVNERIDRAFNVVNQNGTAVCQSVIDGTDPNCVPYNPWRLGAVTPEMLAYLQQNGYYKGSADQANYGGTLSADLGDYGIKFPGATTGVGVALGAERRTEKIQLDTDSLVATGSLSGSGGATPGIAGKYTVNEYYGEVRLPILEGKPMADLLSASASVRHSSYSTDISSNTYGFGLEWAPNRMARVRGSYQKAIRAPNLIELFQAQGLNLFDANEDPCAGATPTATFEQCARTGVTAAQYGNIQDSPAGQYNFRQGGNPNLQPEKAKTYTLGLVLTPMRDMNASIDYFDIKIDDTISAIDPTTSLAQCLNTGSFCNLVQRDRFGTLWLLQSGFVTATNQNIGTRRTSGLDFTFNYAHSLPRGFGRIGFNYIGTYLRKLETEEIPGLGKYDCVGLYGSNKCGAPNPEWRHKIRATWMTPWNVDASATIRYIDAVKVQESDSNPLLAGDFVSYEEKLSSRTYLDLAATWMATKELVIRGGINNVLDKDPPITSQQGPSVFGNGNTFPGTYDALGRKIFINATYKF